MCAGSSPNLAVFDTLKMDMTQCSDSHVINYKTQKQSTHQQFSCSWHWFCILFLQKSKLNPDNLNKTVAPVRSQYPAIFSLHETDSPTNEEQHLVCCI